MNVIGSRPDGWWRDRHAATVALLDAVARWAEAHDERVTVVLERPPRAPLGPSSASGRVDVGWAPSPAPNSADDEIVRRVSADPEPASLRVVTSDAGLIKRVAAAGAATFPAKAFRDLVDPPPGAGPR